MTDNDLALAIHYQELWDVKNIPTEDIPLDYNLISKSNEQHVPCHKYSNYAAVILFPDDNDPIFELGDIDLQQRLKYMAREYHVYLKRVCNLNEAISVTRNIKMQYNIGYLELGGHGSATSLAWPDQILQVGYNKEQLFELFSLLEFGAPIMTLSCFNGKKIKGDNFLDFLAKIARGHQVIGTKCANGKHLKLKLSSARPFIIEYTRGNTNVTVIKQYSYIHV